MSKELLVILAFLGVMVLSVVLIGRSLSKVILSASASYSVANNVDNIN